MRALLCEHLLQPTGWLSPGVLFVGEEGFICRVASELGDLGEAVEHVSGFTIPGVPNLHSHAFQRALAGRTEHAQAGQEDSFWTWRTRMYELALGVSPDELEAIAAQLYVEMLEAGYTSVAEFHYLHHDPSGERYASRAELSLRILAAARAAGNPLTPRPVPYVRGGFDQPPLTHQRRFTSTADEILGIVEELLPHTSTQPLLRLGLAPHSLRAVPPQAFDVALAGVRRLLPAAVIHVHAAEQLKEVNEATAHLGARPVRWILDHQPVDERWCLIHATHLDEQERRQLAASGAVAGLCPTTEANLGDGLFPAAEFLAEGGCFGVGSDSQVAVSPAEELRLLEYGQRLTRQKRNVLVPRGNTGAQHVGRGLFDHAVRGGGAAIGQPVGALVPGMRADLVVLDGAHPRLSGHGPETALDAWIFGGADRAVREVMVGGRWVVRGGRHLAREAIARRYDGAIQRLWAR